MNEKAEITREETLKATEDFPYLRACLSDYLAWLFEKCDEDRRKYDPVFMRISNFQHNLGDLENALSEAGNILGLSEIEFCQTFKFNTDRHKNEILKIGDLVVEPWVAIALKNCGFRSIQKITESSGRFSDFLGEYNKIRFAVEVKNARTDSDFHRWLVDNPSVIMSNYHPDGKETLQKERDFLESVVEQKLTIPQCDKIEEQLRNTAKKYDCQEKMLVLYLEATTLTFFPDQLISQLENARKNYSFNNYLACCTNRELFCSPQLT